MKTLYVIPLFSKYEILPKAYMRLIGGIPFFSHVCKLLLKLNLERVSYLVTDIAEMKDIINDADIIIKLTTLENMNSYFQSLILEENSLKSPDLYDGEDIIITIINPHALLLDEKIIREEEKRLRSSTQNGILVTTNSQRCFDLDSFMNNTLFVSIRRFLNSHETKYTGLSVIKKESLIIKCKNDWILTDRVLKRKRIIFRVDGYIELGMGHIYNCITLAYSLYEHEILIVLKDTSAEGIKKIKEAKLQYKVIKKDSEIKSIIETFRPDIWVNDCLDTTKEYICFLKSKVGRVITIEDIGEGAVVADAAINALYDDSIFSGENVYNGWKYVCLREEFQIEKRASFSEKVHRVLIMFGGTDPSNLNRTVYPIIEEISEKYPDIEFDFVVGIGYDAEINGVFTKKEKGIYVYSNVQRVTKFMKTADLAVTSQGRTIFELASMGVPSIVLSQNERETRHSFAQMENGFLNLGMGKDVDRKMLKNTLSWLIDTPPVRRNMYDLMKKCRLREGLDRVKEIILGRYDYKR